MTAGTASEWAKRVWDFDKHYRTPGKQLGTATQIGISLGVALAHKGTGRLIVDLQPDGDLMFDAGALWVASYYELPLLVVMFNNRAYYNDWEHQERLARQRGTPLERAHIGMEIDNPAPDFADPCTFVLLARRGPDYRPRRYREGGSARRRVCAVDGQTRFGRRRVPTEVAADPAHTPEAETRLGGRRGLEAISATSNLRATSKRCHGSRTSSTIRFRSAAHVESSGPSNSAATSVHDRQLAAGFGSSCVICAFPNYSRNSDRFDVSCAPVWGS